MWKNVRIEWLKKLTLELNPRVTDKFEAKMNEGLIIN